MPQTIEADPARVAELSSLTRPQLVALARRTPREELVASGDPLAAVFGTVASVLSSRARKGEYAYHIARTEAQNADYRARLAV